MPCVDKVSERPQHSPRYFGPGVAHQTSPRQVLVPRTSVRPWRRVIAFASSKACGMKPLSLKHVSRRSLQVTRHFLPNMRSYEMTDGFGLQSWQNPMPKTENWERSMVQKLRWNTFQQSQKLCLIPNDSISHFVGIPTIGTKPFAAQGDLEGYQGWKRCTSNPSSQQFPRLKHTELNLVFLKGQHLQGNCVVFQLAIIKTAHVSSYYHDFWPLLPHYYQYLGVHWPCWLFQHCGRTNVYSYNSVPLVSAFEVCLRGWTLCMRKFAYIYNHVYTDMILCALFFHELYTVLAYLLWHIYIHIVVALHLHVHHVDVYINVWIVTFTYPCIKT